MKAQKMEFAVHFKDGSLEFAVELDRVEGVVRFTEYGSDSVSVPLWRLPWLAGVVEVFMENIEGADLEQPGE